MNQLDLDGAALDMAGREFKYELPAPFGPKRGPAVLTVKARPAASMNKPFRAALDNIMHKARARDIAAEKKFERTQDADALANEQIDAARWVAESVAELNFDHCIIEWSTTIQNKGKDLEPTRENFIALAQFEHPTIRKVFEVMQSDLSDFDKFTVEAETEAQEAEIKN